MCFLLTCVTISVATKGSFRCPMAPLFTAVSVSVRPPLFRYYPLHAVVVHPSPVSVATPGPAVAQRGGRAFHGAVVTYSLGKEQTPPWQREREMKKSL